MKSFAWLALIGLFATMASCTRDASKSNVSSPPAASGGTCTASFDLTYSNEPAANKNLAVFKLADDESVKTSKEFVLGRGKTNASGKATISFTCAAKGTYVILEEIQPEVMMSLRLSNGSFLSFDCGGEQKTCNAGKLNAVMFGH